ncbi:adenosylcobinamide-GDP ribazoletransferase [Variovorax sp. J22R133]|uniref:adenosylcobinamide-GDP ribazoletransferase n=1 Tax=Variovorax brevis TaxID=3053503 RepID=UPI002577F076|nr:adenosylcobinamide-GDP ribazoletransferase [Variovorax sp. J22R133]MDM0112527.1 adenosylcobinamide-GDP ribazoletransferase [Variovorax sp. J22R133]
MNSVRHFLLALQFFTRIPITGGLARWVGFSPAMLRESAGHFPGVGWVIGAIGAAVFGLGLFLLPGDSGAIAAAMLCVVATVWLTGAFHEDGLADVADGLGGSRDRNRALEIMKDSRIGAFGAIALVLAIGLKVSLLGTLAAQDEIAGAAAVLAAHVLSRFAPLFVMRSLPYVGGEGGKAKPLADAVSGASLAVAAAWSLPAVVLVLMTQPLANAAAAALLVIGVTGWMTHYFRQRLEGFTGDCLGATQQVAELAMYLALAVQL